MSDKGSPKPAVPETIDEYIKGFSPDIQKGLQELRDFIRAEVPGVHEKISYGIPAFYLDGSGNFRIYFAAYKDHYGLYPVPAGNRAFEKALAPYRSGKSTLRFALDKPFPWDLLKKVIHFRKEETGKSKK